MFIARQPIFNKTMKVYGYELLYRSSEKARAFDHSSAKKATATVLSGLFELGVDNISDNKISFVNFDYDFLFSDSIELIEPNKLIIEVLENTIVDKKLINRLKALKKKGYKVALDDFIEDYDTFPLTPIADIIKYDLLATPLHSIEAEVSRALQDGKIILAEKVETKEEYERAKEMGFHLFQGYFFKKPDIIGRTYRNKSPKLSYLEIITELKTPEPSYDKLTDIIKTDVSLSYRLLHGSKENENNSDDVVNNIKTALIYMGLNQIERWINILMLQDLATDKPLELTRLSLIRSHFGELLTRDSKLNSRSNEVYGMFLFSTLDAILDLSMEKALDGIALSEDVKKALISQEGELNLILQLVYCYERGRWESVKKIARHINIDEDKISDYYLDAITYFSDVTNSTYSTL